jgi:hypothetical protein
MRAWENPEEHQIQKATVLEYKRDARSLPLTVWNTTFICEGCKSWNWVTLDDRIALLVFPCPVCGRSGGQISLGRKFAASSAFLQRVVLGDLRLSGKPLILACGHQVYLPKLVFERKVIRTGPPPQKPVVSTEITAAPKRKPESRKEKTAPIKIAELGSVAPPKQEKPAADISFDCFKCGQNIVIDEAGAGLQVNCPKCQTVLTVPGAPVDSH